MREQQVQARHFTKADMLEEESKACVKQAEEDPKEGEKQIKRKCTKRQEESGARRSEGERASDRGNVHED